MEILFELNENIVVVFLFLTKFCLFHQQKYGITNEKYKIIVELKKQILLFQVKLKSFVEIMLKY